MICMFVHPTCIMCKYGDGHSDVYSQYGAWNITLIASEIIDTHPDISRN